MNNDSSPPYRIPTSTYRVQLNQRFSFQDATSIIPYLKNLGISDCYTSPYLKAVPGSTHGYDVIDPTMLNPEIGSEQDYQAFIDALRHYNLGHILDIVPNHMGIAEGWNHWWQDVLENGPSSHYANFFDIDWHPVKDELENKVLLPILGDQYGIVLENQEIVLHYEEGHFFVRYYNNHLPLDPTSWVLVLSFRADELVTPETAEDIHVQELQSITTALVNLPLRHERDPNRIAERYREKEVIKRRLAALTQESPTISKFIQENLVYFNGRKGEPRSFDLLDALLSDQAYRLAYWRVASEEINYRRFFDINQLAAIRMEDPQVFQAVHSYVGELLHRRCITGLRVDHVDGLYDPRGYLTQWQQWAQTHIESATDAQGRSLFLLVEKILGKGETLSDDWPVHGTSGYDFLALVNSVFVDPAHKRAFDDIYGKFAKMSISFEDLAYESKKLIMESSMSSEINALGHQLNILSEKNRRSRDFTLNSLIHTIREIIACFPVYRTYVTPDPKEPVTDRDRAYIRLAVTKAKRKNPATNALVFDFVRDLLLKVLDESAKLQWSEVHPFVMKFQQTTSPVTAKGFEDTTFYIYNRLVSLNEVGSDPSQFGQTVPAFHERMRERQERWPLSLSTSSTHDTKRSEDVRARINVLSEIPKEWRSHLTRWHQWNKKKKGLIDDQPVPDRNEEYFLYQTLLGTWPLETMDQESFGQFHQRIQAYMIKALREAKVHTSWINPHEGYEQAVHNFIERILDRRNRNPFLDDFLLFQEKLAYFGMVNALAQLVLKMTAPGIPDFYQGTELWTFTLVDPDNRGAVDYNLRRQWLEQFQQVDESTKSDFVRDLFSNWKDGRIKMHIMMTLLNFRNSHPELFWKGRYLPLETVGPNSEHVWGFQRANGERRLLVIVPRFLTKLHPEMPSQFSNGNLWDHTYISLVETGKIQYKELLTGQVITTEEMNQQPVLVVKELFRHLPLALLEPIA